MKKIFVGNLGFDSTEASVRTLFEEYGAVENVSIITDRDTGRSRGFAFVEMRDASEAERAIGSINGSEVDGRKLSVSEAHARRERSEAGFSRS